jgi:hypothetical protein
MNRVVYRFVIQSHVPQDEIESTLLLTILAAESLHGETDVRLDAAHLLDASGRICVIDATTSVGRDLCRLFAGFLRREFGEDSFRVESPARLGKRARTPSSAGHPTSPGLRSSR